MLQLQLFNTAELAAMRDRTRSRRYSPAGEQFRREHARRRDFGLARRHAEKLRRLHDRRDEAALKPAPTPPADPTAPVNPADAVAADVADLGASVDAAGMADAVVPADTTAVADAVATVDTVGAADAEVDHAE